MSAARAPPPGPAALQFAGALGGLIGAMPPVELFRAANAFLLRQGDDEAFATAVHLLVDLESGCYQITSAGHPPALRLDLPTGEWVIDNARGTALGVLAEPELHTSEGRLFPGEALLFYTDGVVEARNSHIDVGIAWLQRAALEAVGFGFGGAAASHHRPGRGRRRRPRRADPEPDRRRHVGGAHGRPTLATTAYPRPRVQLADHVLDVRLLDRQVGDVVRRDDGGHDRRGRGLGRERQPLPRPLHLADRGAGYVDRRCLVDQVDHERPRGAALRVQPGQRCRRRPLVPWSMTITRRHSASMSCRSWVVSSSVVPRSALRVRRKSRSRPLLTTSRPIVGSSR